jgi:hypothetical protein
VGRERLHVSRKERLEIGARGWVEEGGIRCRIGHLIVGLQSDESRVRGCTCEGARRARVPT